MLSQRQFITLILEKRKRALRMKKLVAVVLALVLVLSVTSAAMAVPFHIVTDSTSIFKVGTA